MKTSLLRKGFTLIELLLVIGIIAILASIVIVAINPTKQLGDARDAQRRSDVNAILNAVYQYAIDNKGTMPGCLKDQTTLAATGICQDGGTCTDLCDLSSLKGKYLVGIPADPRAEGANDTGYTISVASSRITVAAPNKEGTDDISVTR